MHIHSLTRAAIAACALGALAASPALAATVTTQLRVEANGHDIGPGWHYAHDSISYTTSRSPACRGSGDSGSISGPSALGLLLQGSIYTRRLDPVQISDRYDFGPFVCGVGDYPSSDSAFWSFKVDHELAQVGGDQFAIDNSHDQVLWYLVDTATGVNTGNELVLSLADNIVQAGTPVEVTVLEYDVNGDATPAEGVRILGGGDVMTDAAGRATLVFDEAGRHFIRGVRGIDVPTDGTRLCVWEASQSQCDLFIAGRVVGTHEADRISGTDDPDYILGRSGDDRINARDDVADGVRCGPGDDVAIVDPADRVPRNCETVRRG